MPKVSHPGPSVARPWVVGVFDGDPAPPAGVRGGGVDAPVAGGGEGVCEGPPVPVPVAVGEGVCGSGSSVAVAVGGGVRMVSGGAKPATSSS